VPTIAEIPPHSSPHAADTDAEIALANDARDDQGAWWLVVTGGSVEDAPVSVALPEPRRMTVNGFHIVPSLVGADAHKCGSDAVDLIAWDAKKVALGRQ
jgi:hypothetical protein